MEQTYMRAPPNQAGFGLAELMIGLTIGLLATLVIIQVMSFFTGQKSTTTGTADAQTNGDIALYRIGREVQVSGYPLMPAANAALECTTITVSSPLAPYTATPVSALALSPVLVTDGVSDTIQISYGNSASGGIPVAMKAVPSTIPGVTGLDMDNNLACNQGDTTLIINGNTCAISSASAVPAIGASGNVTAEQTTMTLQDNTLAAAGRGISCLGTWNTVTYQVNNGRLERQNLADGAAFVPIVEGIVNLQAQYGISNATNSNQIVSWVEPTGAWATPSVADRNRIKAIRIAVVARNPKMEPLPPVTAACSSTTAANPTGLCAWDGSAFAAPTINLTADANWNRYRYRVFETIIPLRNVIWARSSL